MVAGNTGRDAEYKKTQSGQEFCSFSVAGETGFGDRKQTVWVDVSKWGKGSEGLAKILRKGSRVAVTGEMSLREHNGKTYVQCRADHVKVLGTPGGNNPNGPMSNNLDDYREPADLNDEIPF